MSPHKFVIGTVTDAAKKAIESIGGSVAPVHMYRNRNAFLVTLPDEAHITNDNFTEPRDAINTKWYHIEVAGITLIDTASQDDREGTLDIIERQKGAMPTQQVALWNDEVTA